MKQICLWLGIVLCGLLPQSAVAKDYSKLLSSVSNGLVRVEFDLKFDKGDAPHGILDQDVHGTSSHTSTLGQLVAEERPLETQGYLVAPDMVVAMDPCIHPRFIERIRVIAGTEKSEATVSSYFVDQWGYVLKLKTPITKSKPIAFSKAKASESLGVVDFFRQDGQMIWTVAGFGGQHVTTSSGQKFTLIEHEGLAATADGKAVGVVLNRRIPADDSWQGSPLKWKQVPATDLDLSIGRLKAGADNSLVRVKLTFRSPKNSANQMRERMRQQRNEDEDTDNSATERNVLGVLLPGGKALVLANLRPNVTARLDRIDLIGSDGKEISAKFVATLKDFGAFVAAYESSGGASAMIDLTESPEWIGKLMFRADVSVQGEMRSDYYYVSRIIGVRVGPKMEGYPELPDPEFQDAFLYTYDLKLHAIPVQKRDRSGAQREAAYTPRWLTPARLLVDAVAHLPATGDPANIPVTESDETRIAWLGVELQPMTRELARANGISDQTHDGATGALVTYVHPESPASQAGISPGAIILRLREAGHPLPIEVAIEEDFARAQAFPWDRLDEIREQYFDRIPTPWPPVENNFTRTLTDFGFGTKYTAEFSIDGKIVSKEFEVVVSPVHYESAARFKAESIGITVRNISYEVRRYLQRKQDEPGVIVSKVETGGRASIAGVKPYEVITHVNDQPVTTVKEFEQAIAGGGELRLSIKRMAKGRIVTIKATGGSGI